MKAHRRNVYLDTTCRVQLFLFRFYRYLFRSESRDSPFKLSVKGAIAESIEGSLSRTLSDGIIDSKYQKTRSSNRKRAYFSHPRSPVQSIFVHRSTTTSETRARIFLRETESYEDLLHHRHGCAIFHREIAKNFTRNIDFPFVRAPPPRSTYIRITRTIARIFFFPTSFRKKFFAAADSRGYVN